MCLEFLPRLTVCLRGMMHKEKPFYLVAGQRIVTWHIHLWPHKINVTVSGVLSLPQPVVLTEPARLYISARTCEQVWGGGFHTRALNKKKELSDFNITLGAASMTKCFVTGLQGNIVFGGGGGGLCVLFQSSNLLGLGSPLSADHSAALMATWTLKFYPGAAERSRRWGWRKRLGGFAPAPPGVTQAILLLHKRLLQVPVWQWPLDHWSIMIAG